MGEGALLAKHCFASARTHSRQRLGRAPEGYLQRPLQADPPRDPTECQLLLLSLPLPLPLFGQVQGCKPCRKHTPHTTGMLCCLRFRYGGVDMIISASE